MKEMIKLIGYEYPSMGARADTVGVLADGRRVWINIQYGTADVRHAADCEISRQTACYPRAKCTCGAELGDEDTAALVADARINGKFGRAPQPSLSRDEIERNQRALELDASEKSSSNNGLCPKCGTYCYGDCDSF